MAIFTTLLSVFIQLYVASIYAVKGEEITTMQREKDSLINKNKLLKQNAAKVKSLEYAREHVDKKLFVPIEREEIGYMRIKNESGNTASSDNE